MAAARPDVGRALCIAYTPFVDSSAMQTLEQQKLQPQACTSSVPAAFCSVLDATRAEANKQGIGNTVYGFGADLVMVQPTWRDARTNEHAAVDHEHIRQLIGLHLQRGLNTLYVADVESKVKLFDAFSDAAVCSHHALSASVACHACHNLMPSALATTKLHTCSVVCLCTSGFLSRDASVVMLAAACIDCLRRSNNCADIRFTRVAASWSEPVDAADHGAAICTQS